MGDGLGGSGQSTSMGHLGGHANGSPHKIFHYKQNLRKRVNFHSIEDLVRPSTPHSASKLQRNDEDSQLVGEQSEVTMGLAAKNEASEGGVMATSFRRGNPTFHMDTVGSQNETLSLTKQHNARQGVFNSLEFCVPNNSGFCGSEQAGPNSPLNSVPRATLNSGPLSTNNSGHNVQNCSGNSVPQIALANLALPSPQILNAPLPLANNIGQLALFALLHNWIMSQQNQQQGHGPSNI